jgi:hypothetical protein
VSQKGISILIKNILSHINSACCDVTLELVSCVSLHHRKWLKKHTYVSQKGISILIKNIFSHINSACCDVTLEELVSCVPHHPGRGE